MGVALLVIALCGFINLFFKANEIRLSILRGILGFSVTILLLSEILSLFNSLNYWSIFIGWFFIDVALITYCLRNRSQIFIKYLIEKLKSVYQKLSKTEKFIAWFSVSFLLLLLIQGLIYPTNNWDSMSYHMARIVHWIENESLSHFRTINYPQIISPPFAEVTILNINLLAGNDYFSNVVQWFYLIGTLLGITLVAKRIGLNRYGQLLAALVLICIPEVVLLATSTHTELVVSFFIVAAIYFLIKTTKEFNRFNFMWLGLCLGLAVCAKSTAFIYLASFVGAWLMLKTYQLLGRKTKLNAISYLLLIGTFLIINLGHYSRNYQLTNSIFGTDETIHNYYVNEEHSLSYFLSNVTRNVSLQFGVPHIAHIVYNGVADIHKVIGVDLNEPKITSHTYSIDPLATHENNGANLFHTIFLFFSLLWLVVYYKNQRKLLLVYSLCIIGSFLLFCFYLKWQPWTKLHTPFYILYAIVIAHFIVNVFKKKWFNYIIILGFVSTGLLYAIFNWSRPLLTYPPFTSEIKISDDRYQKYFSRFLEYYPDFKLVNDRIQNTKYESVGLDFGKHEMEYQLFLNAYRNNVKPYHINAHNIAKTIKLEGDLEVIVSTTLKDSILYNQQVYYNTTPNSEGYLFLFEKRP